MPRDPKISLESESVQDQLAATKLAIEKARLAKLEGELPQATPQYTRYEDLPPPPPESAPVWKRDSWRYLSVSKPRKKPRKKRGICL